MQPASTNRPVQRALLAMVAAAGMIAIASCGSDTDATSKVDTLTIDNVRSRPTSPGVVVSAVYLDVTSPIDDTLVAVSTSPDIAAKVSMHQSMTVGGHDMGSMPGTDHSMDDITTMEALPQISLVAGQQVAFEPGGLHLMVEDLVKPLVDGDEFQLTLNFETAGKYTVTVRVTNDI